MFMLKRAFLGFLAALMVFLAAGCNAPAKENAASADPVPQETPNPLPEQYPAFFNLDTTNGLTVFVTSFAAGTYSCSLHPTGQVDQDSTVLWDPNSVDLATMKEILALYALPADAITVVPYQSLLSSYIAVELMQDNAAAWLRSQLGLGELPKEEIVAPEDTGDAPFPYTLCWADNTETGEHALRYTYYPITGTYAYQNELTYPAIGIKNAQELESFLSLARSYFSLSASMPNKETFNEAVKKYDQAFFQENGIVVIYIPSESTSISYKPTDATMNGEELHISVAEIRPEGEPVQKPAGWFMAVELPQEILSQANYFSAGK